MADPLLQLKPQARFSRCLILLSLLASACMKAPPLAVNPTLVAIPASTKLANSGITSNGTTPTAAQKTSTKPGISTSQALAQPSPSPSPAPTPGCTPQPTFFPTQPPASAPAQVKISADGRVQGRILPSPYLAPTYARAPIAWARSTGKGVTVAVTRNHGEDLTMLSLIAPDVRIQPLEVDRQVQADGEALYDVAERMEIQLLAIIEPGDFDPQTLKKSVTELVQAGVTVFVNGDLGSGAEERDLVNTLEASGSITVGRLKYGVRVQGADILHRQINLFAGYGGENATSDRGAVLTVAGVGALALAANPELDPPALKRQLVTSADQMYTGVNPVSNQTDYKVGVIDPLTGEFSAAESAYRFRRVNAARAVGLHLEGSWPQNAQNAPAAWKKATGRGVLVGMLDMGFHTSNPALKDRIVDLFPKQAFGGDQHFHGTIMAKAVIAMAPDAGLVLLHSDTSSDLDAEARSEAAAIDFAVQRGVRVITSSDKPFSNIPEVHAAIDRAISAGVVFVWTDYRGANEDVIRPGNWRSPAWEVGTFTFFLDEDRPAELEGGISFAAPQIAGIAALILENEPQLTPGQVKQRILETATILPNGSSLADAAAAVENRPSGRSMVKPSFPTAASGWLRLEYQAPGGTGTARIEIAESRQNWPVAAWHPQDILLYRAVSSAAGPYATAPSDGTMQLEAYRDANLIVSVEWPGDEVSSASQTARLAIWPDGETQPFFTVELGGGKVPPMQVDVSCDRVRMWWNSADGVALERGSTQSGITGASALRLLSFEVETARMPDLVEPVY